MPYETQSDINAILAAATTGEKAAFKALLEQLLDPGLADLGPRTTEPSSPKTGQFWLRTDLGRVHMRVGSSTLAIALAESGEEEPANTVAPTMTYDSGTDVFTLMSLGTWTNNPTSYEVTLERAGAPIEVIGTNVGATYTRNPTYDTGHDIEMRVRATNGGGSGYALSNKSTGASRSETAEQNVFAPDFSTTGLLTDKGFTFASLPGNADSPDTQPFANDVSKGTVESGSAGAIAALRAKTGHPQDSLARWYREFSSKSHYVEAAPLEKARAFALPFFVVPSDFDTYAELRVSTNGGSDNDGTVGLWVLENGTRIDNDVGAGLINGWKIPDFFATLDGSKKLRAVAYPDNRFQVFFDGQPYFASASPGTLSVVDEGGSDSIYPLPESFAGYDGTAGGISGAFFSHSRFGSFRGASLADPLMIQSVSINAEAGGRLVTFTIFAEADDGFQIAVEALDGTPVATWADADVTAHATTSGAYYISALLTGVDTQDDLSTKYQVRKTDTPDVARSITVTTPVFAPVEPFTLAMNEGEWVYWAGGIPMEDEAQIGKWADETGADLEPADFNPATGYPIAYRAGQTSFKFKTNFGAIPDGTTREIRVPSGMAIADPIVVEGTWARVAANVIQVTKTAFDATKPEHGQCDIQMSGTIPSGGAALTMRQVGRESATNKVSIYHQDFYLTRLGGKVKVIRFMTGLNTNYPLPAIPSATSSLDTFANWARASSLDNMIAMCVELNADLWLNAHDQADATWAAAAAAYIKAKFTELGRPNAKIWLEWCNEVWNNAFSHIGRNRLRCIGLGMWGATGANAPLAPTVVTVGTQFNPNNGLTLIDLTAGQYYIVDRYGFGAVLVRPKVNIAANDSTKLFSGTTDTNWEVIETDGQGALNRRRLQSEQSILLWDAFIAEFGADRIVPVLGGWHAESPESLDDYFNWTSARVPGKTVLDYPFKYATAPYWDKNLGRYASDHKPGFGATEKALYITDRPAWLAAISSVAPTSVTDTVNECRDQKHAVWRLYGRELITYEENQHIIMSGYPDSIEGNAAFTEFKQSAAFRALQLQYLNELRQKVGGMHCWFQSFSYDVGGQGWASKRSPGDTTNATLLALQDFTATLP